MKDIFKGIAVGVVATVTLSGTAYAATGGTFVIGRSNASTTQSTLSNAGSGAVLGLSTRAGQAPLVTSSGSGKALNLNSDRLDGLDSSQLQLRVTTRCEASTAVVGINSNGTVVCAAVDNPVQEKAQFADKGIAISSITLGDCVGPSRARLTNNTDRTVTQAKFQLTYLRDQKVVAVVEGDMDDAPATPGVTANAQIFGCHSPSLAEGSTVVFKIISLE